MTTAPAITPPSEGHTDGQVDGPTDVLFYHLTHQPLEQVLPVLLEKTLQRGWRAVVQAGTPEALDALDEALWTYRDDSFLPHGLARDGHSEHQLIFLAQGDETPNGARVRFLVEGAQPGTFNGFVRMIFLFDGHNLDAVAGARTQWKAAKAAGCSCTYWQQSETGRWEKKA